MSIVFTSSVGTDEADIFTPTNGFITCAIPINNPNILEMMFEMSLGINEAVTNHATTTPAMPLNISIGLDTDDGVGLLS